MEHFKRYISRNDAIGITSLPILKPKTDPLIQSYPDSEIPVLSLLRVCLIAEILFLWGTLPVLAILSPKMAATFSVPAKAFP
jgi:hypothetical protein